MMIYMVFGLIWVVNLISAITSFTTNIAASTYYFNSNASLEGEAEVGFASKMVWGSHIGTLALSSFVMTLVFFVKIVFQLILEAFTRIGDTNGPLRCIGNCAMCLLSCIESCIDYFEKSAFAYIAVSGESFCDGCYNGMLLNLKHGLEFAWAMVLATGFVWIGKLAIVTANVFVAFNVMKYYTHEMQTDGGNITTPLIFVGILTFIIADVFLSQFDEAVQSMLTCICVDKDLNHNARYGPPTFHDRVAKVSDS